MGSVVSSVFDPGKKDRKRAGRAAGQAVPTSGGITGPGGLSASFGFDAMGRGSQQLGLGQFDPFLQQLFSQAQQGFGLSQSGLDPRLEALGAGAIGDLADPNLQSFGNASNIAGLEQVFQSALGTASADPFALGQGVADKLRPGVTRAQETLRNETFSQLFGGGQSAVSAAASPVLEGLQKQFAEQNQALDVTGLQVGMGLQQDAFGRLMGAAQGRESIFGRLFGEQATTAGMRGQFAQQRFDIGSSLQQLLMSQLGMGQQLGLQALQGATGLSQLPLSFANAMQGLQTLRSNALLGQANVHQANAASTPSIFGQVADVASGFGSWIR